jgi:hypothetical protein
MNVQQKPSGAASQHAQTLASADAVNSNKPNKIGLKFDRVAMTINPEEGDEEDHKNAIRETMIWFAKKGHYPFEYYGRITTRGGRYETALRVHAPNPPGDPNGKWSKVFALLQCNPRNGMGGYLRLEFNPAKWSPQAKSHLFGTVSAVTQHTPQFNQLLGNGKLTRFDVAMDVYGIRPDGYLWELSRCPYRDPVVHFGMPETIYLGNRSAAAGKGIVRVYDKGIEMGAPDLVLTRIERDCRSNTLRVRDLFDLPNVFRNVHCWDAHAALSHLGAHGIPPMFRSMFHDSCAYRGLPHALARVDSEQLRQRLEAAIRSSVPAFWDLNAIWSLWPAAVADVFSPEPVAPPEYVEPPAGQPTLSACN